MTEDERLISIKKVRLLKERPSIKKINALKKAFVERNGETYLEDGLVIVPGKFSPVVSMVTSKFKFSFVIPIRFQ